jgi:prepilin-type processing-associated H-X9-DG protein
MGWIVSEPNHTKYFVQLGPHSSTYGAAVEPINKYPVTDTFLSFTQYATDFAGFRNGTPGHYCKASYEGGSHSVSNYRSDHPGGCNILTADGSVKFFNETIDLTVFRGYSTIAGEEINGPIN